MIWPPASPPGAFLCNGHVVMRRTVVVALQRAQAAISIPGKYNSGHRAAGDRAAHDRAGDRAARDRAAGDRGRGR